jgi:putative intracellular protease/amidase
MGRSKNVSLAVIGHKIGPVESRVTRNRTDANPRPPTGATISPAILATHTFATAPPVDVLLIPGGGGNRVLADNNDTAVEDFVAARYPQLEYLLSVCTGSVSIAKSGLLEGRKATSNKAAWAWVVTHGKNVTWVPSARWVEDGNIWTSSGVSAGMFPPVGSVSARPLGLDTSGSPWYLPLP